MRWNESFRKTSIWLFIYLCRKSNVFFHFFFSFCSFLFLSTCDLLLPSRSFNIISLIYFFFFSLRTVRNAYQICKCLLNLNVPKFTWTAFTESLSSEIFILFFRLFSSFFFIPDMYIRSVYVCVCVCTIRDACVVLRQCVCVRLYVWKRIQDWPIYYIKWVSEMYEHEYVDNSMNFASLRRRFMLSRFEYMIFHKTKKYRRQKNDWHFWLLRIRWRRIRLCQ